MKMVQKPKNIANVMIINKDFANVGIKMANSTPKLNEEVKAPKSNNLHNAPVKSLFLTPCSDDEIFSLSLLDNKQAARNNDVNTKFITHGKTVIAPILCKLYNAMYV